MAVIDDYFFELEERLNKAENDFEFEVLQKEIIKIYFPPEKRTREKTARTEYRAELMKYYIDKEKLVSDLKEIGMSYHTLAKSAGLKSTSIQRGKKGNYITLMDEGREKIQEVSGLDVNYYTLSTEPAFRQPQRPINAGPIKEALEIKGIKKYKLSMNLYDNSSALDAYINKETMPLHRTKELCDILGLEHSEVIIKED